MSSVIQRLFKSTREHVAICISVCRRRENGTPGLVGMGEASARGRVNITNTEEESNKRRDAKTREP